MLSSNLIHAGEGSDKLLEIDVPIIDQETCRQAYVPIEDDDRITDNVICAGNGNGKSTCQVSIGRQVQEAFHLSSWYIKRVIGLGHRIWGPAEMRSPCRWFAIRSARLQASPHHFLNFYNHFLDLSNHFYYIWIVKSNRKNMFMYVTKIPLSCQVHVTPQSYYALYNVAR